MTDLLLLFILKFQFLFMFKAEIGIEHFTSNAKVDVLTPEDFDEIHVLHEQ